MIENHIKLRSERRVADLHFTLWLQPWLLTSLSSLLSSLPLSLPLHRKTVVIGSGYIAVELAGILNALGSDVTLVVRYDRVLRSFDRMLSDSLMAELDAAGVKVVKFSKVKYIYYRIMVRTIG